MHFWARADAFCTASESCTGAPDPLGQTRCPPLAVCSAVIRGLSDSYQEVECILLSSPEREGRRAGVVIRVSCWWWFGGSLLPGASEPVPYPPRPTQPEPRAAGPRGPPTLSLTICQFPCVHTPERSPSVSARSPCS